MDDAEEVTRCTLTSRRWPTMDIGSRMLSCESTRNSCGRTCRMRRSSGSVTLRAASTARRMSSRSISRGRFPSVMPPRLLTPRMWLPATPTMARSTGTPATLSASSIARRIDVAVAPRLAISPLRSPFDSAAPMEMNFAAPESSTSLSRAHVFVLPTSSATKYLSFLVKPPLLQLFAPVQAGTRARNGIAQNFLPPLPHGLRPQWSALRRAGRHRPDFRIHHHLPREPQIHGIHPSGAGPPLVDILSQQVIAIGEIGIAKVHEYRRRIARGRAKSGQCGANIGAIGKIHFADVVVRAGQRLLGLLHEPDK